MTAYGTAAVLAGLLATAVLPPLVTDTSRRAVIDAPLMLVTSPIAGDVRSITAVAGEAMLPDQSVADIQNERVERSTLITLQNQVETARVQLDGMGLRRAILARHFDDLKEQLELERAQLVRQMRALEDEGRARVAFAAGILGERAQVERRQKALSAKGVVSGDPVELTARQTAQAREELAAAQAILARRTAQREAVEAGTLVGEYVGGSVVLAAKVRDVELELWRLAVDEQESRRRLDTLMAAADAEEVRIGRLRHAEVASSVGGTVMRVHVAPGRHVAPGETLASATDCRKSFVAAIFSIRHAPRLAVGTAVLLTGGGPRRGKDAGRWTPFWDRARRWLAAFPSASCSLSTPRLPMASARTW